MEKPTIDYKDLYSELKNPPKTEETDFNEWYEKNTEKLTEIKKTKNGFKILVILLSGILFILSLVIQNITFWSKIFQFVSLISMISIWIFVKQVTINPDKELSIMRILFKVKKDKS